MRGSVLPVRVHPEMVDAPRPLVQMGSYPKSPEKPAQSELGYGGVLPCRGVGAADKSRSLEEPRKFVAERAVALIINR